MVILIMYARGARTTPSHDLIYFLMDSFHSCHIRLVTLGSMSGSLYSSWSLFCSARRCIVSLCTPVTSHLKVHFHGWWNRIASFRFSWAMTETGSILRTEFELYIHILDPQGDKFRSFHLMLPLDPFCDLVVHCPLTQHPNSMQCNFHIVCIVLSLYLDHSLPQFLALGKQWSSINDVSCYCHCDDYSSCKELQCRLTIIKSLPQLHSWPVTCVYSMQWLCLHHGYTSSVTWWEITGLVFHLPCAVFFIPLHYFVFGSHILDYYIHNLRL